MSTNEPTSESRACAERIRKTQRLLFGDGLGNEHRAQGRSLQEKSAERFVLAIQETRKAILDFVCEAPSTAELALAELARKKPHGSMIFLALDLANLCLMNPQPGQSGDSWEKDLCRVAEKPVALVMHCLETLEWNLRRKPQG